MTVHDGRIEPRIRTHVLRVCLTSVPNLELTRCRQCQLYRDKTSEITAERKDITINNYLRLRIHEQEIT